MVRREATLHGWVVSFCFCSVSNEYQMMVYFPWINDFVDTTCKKPKANKGNRSILIPKIWQARGCNQILWLSFRPSANFLPNFEPKLASEENNKCLNNGILLPKLFWPAVRKKCSSDTNSKFEAKGWEFSKFLRSLEQFKQRKVRTIFGNRILFKLFPGGFSDLIN